MISGVCNEAKNKNYPTSFPIVHTAAPLILRKFVQTFEHTKEMLVSSLFSSNQLRKPNFPCFPSSFVQQKFI